MDVSHVSVATMAAVGIYVAATAPFLPLLLIVHRQGGAYTGPFVAALVLQLVPIGLVFVPLGFIGVGMLGWTLWATDRRLRAFRRSGLDSPEVHGRWLREHLTNLVAFGVALEQKTAALLFLDASAGGGLRHLWTGLLPASVALWLVLAWPIWEDLRALRALPRPEAA